MASFFKEINPSTYGGQQHRKTITIRFGEETKSTKTDDEGAWSTTLGPLSASSKPRTLTVTSEGYEIQINDILVGEVWLCGGQSNMAWTLRGSTNADIEISAADYPEIRFLKLQHSKPE